MCIRYIAPEEAEIERLWQIGPGNQPKWWKLANVFPRAQGPFIRLEPGTDGNSERTLVIGQWGLIPWFAKSPKLTYTTNNARSEEVATKASFKHSWNEGKRCIIPAWSLDEPCWGTGRNIWWRFKRADGNPWGLAGLWNTWIDKATGEIVESYTMLTINADNHPIMSRMHKQDPKLPPDRQNKRSVIAIHPSDCDLWLRGSEEEAKQLLHAPDVEDIATEPLS